ncbi:MAG TPA: substrate-binding domain-containing protein [Conexibacter sp.]
MLRVFGSKPGRWIATALACTGAAFGFAACGDSSDSGDTAGTVAVQAGQKELPGGASLAGKKVLFLIHSTPDDTFFTPAINGAKAAAALTGLEVQVEYGNNDDATTRRIVNTAIANGIDALDLGIQDAGLNEVLCQAKEKRIPLVSYNVNGATGAGADCVPAFVGQDFVASGETVAQRLIDSGLVKSGDTALCPVEFPALSYAVERYQGVMNVLREHGIKCDELGTGVQPGDAKAKEVNYLIGHPDTAAILGLGNFALTAAAEAVKQVKRDIPIVGFDLSEPVLNGIKDGTIIASIDQQPYSQGYLSIMQLALQMKYGLTPASINTSNGALVDRSNVNAVTSLVPDYR